MVVEGFSDGRHLPSLWAHKGPLRPEGGAPSAYLSSDWPAGPRALRFKDGVTWSSWAPWPPSTWTSTSSLPSWSALLSFSRPSSSWPSTGQQPFHWSDLGNLATLQPWWHPHSRIRRSPNPLKEIDYDIRENIINYKDEGGSEGDQDGFLGSARFTGSANLAAAWWPVTNTSHWTSKMISLWIKKSFYMAPSWIYRLLTLERSLPCYHMCQRPCGQGVTPKPLKTSRYLAL